MITINKQLKEAKKFIRDADAILITAGAGIGVDSGLPDFRGNEGFWKAYPVIKDLGVSFQDMANPQWFDTNPKLAWAFYGHRLNLYRDTTPHKGFEILLDLVKEKNDDYFIFTSNVDGQFQKAQFDEEKIMEVHGSIHHFQCSENCKKDIWDADETLDVDMDSFEALDIPKCKNCSAVARPNILMFGDWDWNEKRTLKQEARFNRWLKQMKIDKKRLAVIEIGAGIEIATVRRKGESIAKVNKNAKVIRINPRDFEIDETLGFSLPLGGVDGLQKLTIR
ncbi:MAG: Sir2 family NAD-dependent protein deacetylase [Campylobacterota bacterium]|nr:Sir2 family NAD-dependent protein deacetylase [Campylobacterota bacterium]